MSQRSALTDLAMRTATGAPLRAFNALISRPPGVNRETGLTYGPLSRHRLDVYRPSAGDLPPLMVFFHGGAWEVGSRAEYAFAGRAYAAEGFATVVPDYRLTGEAPFPAFLEDCARVVAWCQANAAQLGADPARTVLGGHSAGAYNAAMLALDGRWLAQAGALFPVRAWAGLSGPYDFLPLDRGAGLRAFGHVADLAATQPIHYVGPRSPPAFLACGGQDKIVRPGNTERLAARLREAGVEVEAQVYDGADHSQPLLALAWPLRRRLPVLAQSAAFLRAAPRS